MKQRPLVTSIIMGLCASFVINSAMAQSADDQSQEKKKNTELQSVVVTGSLIPRAQIETASPTLTITSADIKKQGFTNVYDALRAMPTAQGAVQDNQSNNSFTPGATTISMLGLSPSYTLILLNGKPMADYPLLYNSDSNFVDLSSIPMAMVDHIDILPGNNSAIYGSQAIAGVVNIITKQNLDGVTLDFRAGGYTDGGGAQQRLQISGGGKWGKLDVLGAIQMDNQNPIFGYQRSYTASALMNPTISPTNPAIASLDRRALNPATNTYVDPGAATCNAISNLFNGGEFYAKRPNFGSYCGSWNGNSYSTFLNGSKGVSGYVSAKYHLNDTTQIYFDFVGNTAKQVLNTAGTLFWASGRGMPTYIYDRDTQTMQSLQHVLAPEETGSRGDKKTWSESYIVNLGIRGAIGDSNWNYDGSYHRSDYMSGSKRLRPLVSKVNSFYLGPQDGTFVYKGTTYPAYHIVQNGKFWGAITPDEFSAYSDEVRSDSSTYTQQLNLTVTNSSLLSLPGGEAGVAAVLEVGDQYWDNPVDPRITAGQFWGTGGTSGHGKRDRYAGAFEFNLPVLSMLTVDLSGRYDRYSVTNSSQGKLTYKAGLEFRPIETVLLRANYGTGFRAPDMGFIFSTGSQFFSNVTDYYNCRKAQGDGYKTCNPPYNSVQIGGNSMGNPNLKYITAKSFGWGGVWSPTSNLVLKADYVHVRIANEIRSYSTDQIMQKEADCRLGHTRGGTAVDPNSQTCQQYYSQVSRTPANAPLNPTIVNGITTYPLNLAAESVSNIIAGGSYRLETGRFGDVILGANYNVQTSHQIQTFPHDPFEDLLREASYGNQFKNIGAASLTWNVGSWSSTLQYQRFGKTWSYDGSRTVGPWMRYNATVQYNFSDDASMTLIGNNILNARPPKDPTFSAYPYYDLYSYNNYGRLLMLEMNVHFGGGKK
ncbi:MAG: TonB-dependent receptor [Proteobacteria bacterium]|mgnify:CR=1 FL=1|nr:TonB-dependent receptor [Pseudomonadota bacterium]